MMIMVLQNYCTGAGFLQWLLGPTTLFTFCGLYLISFNLKQRLVYYWMRLLTASFLWQNLSVVIWKTGDRKGNDKSWFHLLLSMLLIPLMVLFSFGQLDPFILFTNLNSNETTRHLLLFCLLIFSELDCASPQVEPNTIRAHVWLSSPFLCNCILYMHSSTEIPEASLQFHLSIFYLFHLSYLYYTGCCCWEEHGTLD